jgi:hypothetical protein
MNTILLIFIGVLRSGTVFSQPLGNGKLTFRMVGHDGLIDFVVRNDSVMKIIDASQHYRITVEQLSAEGIKVDINNRRHSNPNDKWVRLDVLPTSHDDLLTIHRIKSGMMAGDHC